MYPTVNEKFLSNSFSFIFFVILNFLKEHENVKLGSLGHID